MSVILTHPTANNFARALAKSLEEADLLYEFNTAIASFPGDFLDYLGSFNLLSELRRRRFDIKLQPLIRSRPWTEIGRLIALKSGLSNLTRHETGYFCVDAVYRDIDNWVARTLQYASTRGVAAVYSYEDAAFKSFEKAKSIGLKCIYDLPIAYWESVRKLLSEEAERLPAWADTLGGGIWDSSAKVDRKIYELELADLIVVPSKFVKESIPEWANEKQIIIAPFGTPKITNEHTELKIKRKNGNFEKPLRILFAGSMGQRKGLGDLFNAIKLLNTRHVELIIMGSLQADMKFYRSQFSGFIYEPGRPNEEVLALMRSCDIFCLPSIVEGRALVMQEAMSQGMPLIITPNTGGDDLIEEGTTGFLVPIRAPAAIAEKINWFLEHRNCLVDMGINAQNLAARYTWEDYGKTIVGAIKEILR